jgi:acyl dehydratase
MASHPKLSFDDLPVGESYEAVLVENLTRTQIVQYAGASGDFNPIHHDERFAQQAGYPSVFAHGMLSMGLAARLLTDWLGDGVLRSFGVRFVRQVWPGDTLTGRATVRSVEPGEGEGLVGLDVVATNQKGEAVVTGEATAALPRRG